MWYTVQRLVSFVFQQAVEEAYVPVIKLEYDGVEVIRCLVDPRHLTTFHFLLIDTCRWIFSFQGWLIPVLQIT